MQISKRTIPIWPWVCCLTRLSSRYLAFAKSHLSTGCHILWRSSQQLAHWLRNLWHVLYWNEYKLLYLLSTAPNHYVVTTDSQWSIKKLCKKHLNTCNISKPGKQKWFRFNPVALECVIPQHLGGEHLTCHTKTTSSGQNLRLHTFPDASHLFFPVIV